MATLLKGAPVALAIQQRTAATIAQLSQKGITPRLALLRVGARADDLAYEKSIRSRCEKLGIALSVFEYETDVSTSALIEKINELARDKAVHGIMIFRPLPKSIDETAVCDAIPAQKDVDCVSAASLAGVFCVRGGFAPCTAQACVELLDFYNIPLEGARATVVGRSLVVGKPLAMLLMQRNATVTVCHTRTKELAARCAEAQVLAVCAGRAGVVGADCLREGQTVLDVGINEAADGGICGDVASGAADEIDCALTPVPGGLGAVTSMLLMEHVVTAAKNANP